jgi:hypothetical protein
MAQTWQKKGSGKHCKQAIECSFTGSGQRWYFPEGHAYIRVRPRKSGTAEIGFFPVTLDLC